VLLVEYEGGASTAKWFLGAEDNLPRRVERFASNGDLSGSQVLVVSGLSFPGDLTAEDFRPGDVAGMSLEDYRSVLETGSQAPDWTLATPDGREVTLSALLDTVVVLDFWATWCGPCASAMPGMQELHDSYLGSPVRILGINVWESGDPAAFMADNGYTYDILLEGDPVAEEYLVSGIPTFYLIDRQGRVAWFARGFDPANEAELASRIDEALQP
jgi:thiol-disulfide isomerase/thioredoxin